MSREPSTVLLVHGAFGGSWVWELVRPLLDRRGVGSITVDLPSVGADPSDVSGLAGDVAAVARVLDGGSGPFVVCGHSYGGMVVTEAVSGCSNVVQLVYLCAFLPAAGESLMMLSGGPAPWIQPLDDGRVQVDPVHARTVGYVDCPPDVRDAAVARLRPQVPVTFGQPVSAGRPAHVPTTYVICTEDASLPVELQRDVFAPRADDVVELASGHSPFFSMPERVADLLAERALQWSDFNDAIIEEFRANGGRVGGRWEGRDLLLLTTTGRKSGRLRTNPMVFTRSGDRLLVYASNGGAAAHPAWYLNLLADPRVVVEVGVDRFEATAAPLQGEERDREFAAQVARVPTFGEYERTAGDRVIPVVALTRLPG